MPPEPGPHTEPELARLLRLAHELPAHTVTIGHGRHEASRASATAFAHAWEADGGDIVAVVDWPASAASWLRPARRLTAGAPDAWVIADTPAGWAHVAHRLAGSPNWAPDRTLGFASLDDVDLVRLAGGAVRAMAGATTSGGTWRVGSRMLVRDDA